MKTVFDIKPTRRGPATGNEKIHEFFAREGRPEVVPIRDWIEFWYSRLPSAKQRDIRGRLRSCDVHQVTPAYFELQMFALLRNMGYAVTVEPSLAAGHYNPDFLAQREGESFYLEATVCGANGGAFVATRNEQDAVEKLRSALQHPSFDLHSDLWLKSEGKLNHTLSKRNVTKPFIDLLRRTTAVEVEESYGSGHYYYDELQVKYGEEIECGELEASGLSAPQVPARCGWTRSGTFTIDSRRRQRGDQEGPRRKGERLE